MKRESTFSVTISRITAIYRMSPEPGRKSLFSSLSSEPDRAVGAFATLVISRLVGCPIAFDSPSSTFSDLAPRIGGWADGLTLSMARNNDCNSVAETEAAGTCCRWVRHRRWALPLGVGRVGVTSACASGKGQKGEKSGCRQMFKRHGFLQLREIAQASIGRNQTFPQILGDGKQTWRPPSKCTLEHWRDGRACARQIDNRTPPKRSTCGRARY